ncbi:hypothetical protein [Sulfurospirillum barnesii]|uniref:Uncharacterized protein n=1 Tax=Sulfurospirillum barnesii (strain ATCC 700032 / DSM 10660 / SES-3) TaxID=760154 RepID=I3Y074_SULBS|nr:hypothetical protein [Sulfurospirillum barnesii]AFL69598.1 hypothetical protein Sulba_2328 [Sulfurospirillum barnesii SES-3]
MKFQKPSKQSIAVATLLILSVGFIAVQVDYHEHQKPLKYAALTMDQKAELYHINKRLTQIERDSDDEDRDNYEVFKATGKIRSKLIHTFNNSEYKDLRAQREALFNPPTRKTEGFGYAVLNFLGFKK